MRAILPLALLALTACYTPRAVASQGDPYDAPETWGIAPLEASIFYHEHDGYATVDLSRPAHVAIFALQPGGGMSMIYPAIGLGRRTGFQGGRHMLRTVGPAGSLTGYRSSRMGASSRWGASTAFGQGPTYILLIASDDPLDIGSFYATRTMTWLNRSAITYSPYVALDALVGEIVPRPHTSAWTTAMHVVWPLDAWPRDRDYRDRYIRVRCASGIEVLAPAWAVMAGYPICAEHLQQPPADSTDDEILEALPKRPRPPEGWMTTTIGDLDLEKELDRLRKVHGKRDPGELSVRPFPAAPPRERTRDIGVARRGSSDDGLGSRRTSSPSVERSRPATRPASRPATRPASRPEARPARPAPARPVSKPAPAPASKPATPSRPTKPVKPTKPGGGGGGADPAA
ncbi:MAG TPA: hypothetical protein VMM12_14715 [Longimicrobiales bacterium]|nr:hypothetical protein [Longimicrobiales bacterium]